MKHDSLIPLVIVFPWDELEQGELGRRGGGSYTHVHVLLCCSVINWASQQFLYSTWLSLADQFSNGTNSSKASQSEMF